MVEIQAAAKEAATVRKATPADVPQISEVLAGAFYADPPFTWVLHRDPRRRDTLNARSSSPCAGSGCART